MIYNVENNTEILNKMVNENWQGNGYNLIQFPYADGTMIFHNVIYTVNPDGSIKADGMPSGAGSEFYLARRFTNLKIGKNYILYNFSNRENTHYGIGITVIKFYDSNDTLLQSYNITGQAVQFSVPNNTAYADIIIQHISGINYKTLYKPMLVEVSANGNAPTKFERYAMGNVELTNNLTANNIPFRFGYDSETQKYGYIVKEAGTDVLVPFKSNEGGNIKIGSFVTTNADAHYENIGFKPKYLVVNENTSSTPTLRLVSVYSEESSTSQIAFSNLATGSCGFSALPNTATHRINSIDNNGFTIKPASATASYWNYFAIGE